MSILTKQEIRQSLGKTTLTDAEKELVDLLHLKAEGALKLWMQQNLEYTQHVELLPAGERIIEDDELIDVDVQEGRIVTRDQTGGRLLQLTHCPVWNTDLTVYVDTAANAGQAASPWPASTLLTKGVDYWLDVSDATNGISESGLLIHQNAWPDEPRTVKVTYYGGSNMSELMTNGHAIKLAALKVFQHTYWQFKNRMNGTGRIGSKSIGKASWTYERDSIGAMGVSVPHEVQQDLWPLRNYGYL